MLFDEGEPGGPALIDCQGWGIGCGMCGFDRYTWPATSYLVAATVAYPIAGRLSDIHGRRAFLIAGIATFIVGSALVGVSASRRNWKW